MIKKFVKPIAAIMSLVTALSVSAITISQTVNPATFTNLLTLRNGSAHVSQLIVTAGAASGTLQFVDAYTNQLWFTNAAYTNVLSQFASQTNVFTNYYNVLQTNIYEGLVDTTNNVAGFSNALPVRVSIFVPTNGTVVIPTASYYFYNGIWLTNNGGTGPITATATYQQ